MVILFMHLIFDYYIRKKILPTIAIQHIKTSWLMHISCMHKSSSHSDILFSNKQSLESSALRAVGRGYLCDKWAGRCSPWAIRTLCSHQATQDLDSLQAMSVIYTYWQIKVSHCMCLGPFNIQRNEYSNIINSMLILFGRMSELRMRLYF